MKNNTAIPLSCMTIAGRSGWELVDLPPGGEWSVLNGERRYFYCRQPVDQIQYRLVPGERYSLLRDSEQAPVTLRRIAEEN
ncbi:MAG: hypothetical protein ACTS1Z_01635 [Parasphingopyxis sp.]|uniref:hypothetical protein n=1 Tax=Parasphingopyxis sp. TaxID=1920299 RepID=UPI003F9FFF33